VEFDDETLVAPVCMVTHNGASESLSLRPNAKSMKSFIDGMGAKAIFRHRPVMAFVTAFTLPRWCLSSSAQRLDPGLAPII
jgi:hypothetical protein